MCAGIPDQKFAYRCQKEKNKTLLKELGVDVDNDQPNVTMCTQHCFSSLVAQRLLSTPTPWRAV